MENAVGNNAKLSSRRRRLSLAPNLHSNEPRHWDCSWNMRCGENQVGLKKAFSKGKSLRYKWQRVCHSKYLPQL